MINAAIFFGFLMGYLSATLITSLWVVMNRQQIWSEESRQDILACAVAALIIIALVIFPPMSRVLL